MLILTRRVNEIIVIQDDIKITVIGIKGNQARLGIEAPKDTPVHREEIHEKIRAENKLYTDNHKSKIDGEDDE